MKKKNKISNCLNYIYKDEKIKIELYKNNKKINFHIINSKKENSTKKKEKTQKMFRNLLGGEKSSSSSSSSSSNTHGMPIKSSTEPRKAKEQCPHCNHSFFNSLKSHLRLNKSCGTKNLTDTQSDPRIKKPTASSSSSYQQQIKSKAMLLMAKQSKLDKLDSVRLASTTNDNDSAIASTSTSTSTHMSMPPSQTNE